jgi:diguanylate cyclase (GGDEF)-like protein/putative nucleotidyltransferase with HDIG domain
VDKEMRFQAKLFIGLIVGCGGWAIYRAIVGWHSDDLLRFFCNLAVCVLVSGLKVNLPGIKGTMSVNFLFILIGVSQMSLGETMVLGCAGTLVQCIWKAKNPVRPVRLLFSVSSMAIAVTGCYAFCGFLPMKSTPSLLLAASLVFFFMNTAPVAGVVALTENKRLAQTWRDTYFWSFPFYVVGASIAWLLCLVSQNFNWLGSLLLMPILYFVYRSYRVYLDKLEDEKRHAQDEKRHAEEVAGLHLRTIEALALAIEAKDQATHEHLRRVRTYVEEIGKDMHLSALEMDGLRAAALLHDIGKLAVPEHILSKPGKMTAEEFEKMKIHPIVGAEILECVGFPCPVAPIVEAHHEKWDGSGYPFGLKGEEIPIGARILAVADSLDALASDRQYRRALPLDQAMAQIESLSGKSFDPRVVEVLKLRYRELERMAQAQPLGKPKLSKDLKIGHGLAPAAGLEVSNADKSQPRYFLDSIAAARQEVRLLFELTRELGSSLSLKETLSVAGIRLKRLIPYDAIAVYIVRDDFLVPEYANGEDFRLFSSLQIPIGQGISGWVAEKEKPILNGNPSVECAYLKDPQKFSQMRSALAVPLEGLNGTVGVLTLYRSDKDAFSRDNLRILLAISSKVSLSIENALKFRQAEDSATTDYLTNLPNSRSLFPRLESELARCRRENSMLTVVVCDLNGFKQINDRYGHLEGNRMLRDISETLRVNCREYDYVARMGGDEFVLLLLGNDQRDIDGRIDQLRQIECHAGSGEGLHGQVSMSVGAAVFPQDGADADELLAEADRRMYKAKQAHKQKLTFIEAAIAQPALDMVTIQ